MNRTEPSLKSARKAKTLIKHYSIESLKTLTQTPHRKPVVAFAK